MNNVDGVKYCYGCGVCAIACPKKIISICLNEDGFYSPCIIEKEKCISCALCLKVCSYLEVDVSSLPLFEIKSYASWSKDLNIRLKCSSGGIGFELGKYLIQQGYKACGVKYNVQKHRAEHFIATSVEEFLPSIGSKYIPSYTISGFSQFNRKDKFFVTGTPCQIDSLRRYIRLMKMEDNFILMDFFCHGVPSMLMWNKYLAEVGKIVGKINDVSWRNKLTGWHDSWAIIVNNEKREDITTLNHDIKSVYYSSRYSQGDLFYKFFLGNRCLGQACYDKCKYKSLSSAADIRIGDLWGTVYKDNEEGVSGVVAFTERGFTILSSLGDTVCLKNEDSSVLLEGQMRESAKRTDDYLFIKARLRRVESLKKIDFLIWVRYILKHFLYIIKNRIKRIFDEKESRVNNNA